MNAISWNVKNLIEWLKMQSPNAKIYIDDHPLIAVEQVFIGHVIKGEYVNQKVLLWGGE
jgi:hypothetical protein